VDVAPYVVARLAAVQEARTGKRTSPFSRAYEWSVSGAENGAEQAENWGKPSGEQTFQKTLERSVEWEAVEPITPRSHAVSFSRGSCNLNLT